MRTTILIAVAAALLAGALSAAPQTFTREYVYEATDYDSRLTCRAIALEQVKRSLLDELGTYLESSSEYRQGVLVRDDIAVMTAGIVQVKVQGETWDGKNYWIKAELTADPDSVLASLRAVLADRDRARELLALKARADQAMQEIDRLRHELAAAQSDNFMFARQISYLRQAQVLSSAEWAYRGTAYLIAGDNGLALGAFTKALENDSASAVSYANRGVLYARAGDYLAAFKDYSAALRLDPKNPRTFYNRGIADFKLGDLDAAVRDFSEAVALAPDDRPAWFNRALAYQQKKQYQKSVLDFDRAVALDSTDAAAFVGRGASQTGLRQYKPAIADYSRAIALDPNNGDAFAGRAEARLLAGDQAKAFDDAQAAAALGNQDVRVLLDKLQLLLQKGH
ncbi:MAG TPA: tetratricopeptide repeat protein [Candidatus Edwardsbacteria bacterium]|nr:tetratricopeptide repeat protein [Candidatus Edwardsbacteria bacterium]